jgi:tricarballylate dehydrogenase
MSLPSQIQVLVVGGGNAGLCAAITARKAGAEVLLLEHAPPQMRGGNTRHTRNFRAMHEKPTGTLSDSYTADEYREDLWRVTQGHTNKPLAEMMIDHSAELLPWLGEQGVRFQPSLSGTLSLGRTNAFFLGGGKALVNALYLSAEKLGVKIEYYSEVVDLTIQDGVFISASVINRGFSYDIKAEQLIVTSGGFQANLPWLKEAWGDAAENFIIRGTPYNRGTVLKSLMQNKVQTIGEPSQCHAVAIDARAPKFDGGIVTRVDCVSFSIVVNKLAQRFYDEGENFWPKRYAIWGRLVAAQPEQIAYSIIDDKVSKQFMPSVFPSIKANSIAELAEKISLDPTKLQQTVDEYNQALQSGTYDTNTLDDCCTQGLAPAKSHWALAINTPPYYAYPLRPGITFTYLGVAVNDKAQIMMESGQASKNMYAAGEIMAGNILGRGYCAGTGMAIGGVFGRIAGQEAACQLK